MSPKELVHKWVDAFNRADPDVLAACYAENAVNHKVAEAEVQGRDGYWDKLSFLRQQGLPLPKE